MNLENSNAVGNIFFKHQKDAYVDKFIERQNAKILNKIDFYIKEKTTR